MKYEPCARASVYNEISCLKNHLTGGDNNRELNRLFRDAIKQHKMTRIIITIIIIIFHFKISRWNLFAR